MNEKELIKRKDSDWEIADFLWEILRRWRLILICILAGAVLLSGYQLLKDLKAAKTTPQQAQVKEEQTIESMEKALGKQDMDEVLAVVATKKQLDEKSAYSKESALMKINPYAENVLYLQYYVTGELAETDYVTFFEQHILNGAYVTELVDVVIDNNNTKNSFVVRVRGLSAEECKETAEQVKAGLLQYTQKLNKEVPGISLTLIEENAAVVVDEELVDLQNQTSAMLKQLNNNLDSLKSNMTGDQLALYVKYSDMLEKDADDKTETSEQSAKPQVAESKANVRISPTKLVIGAVIGMVLAVVWILLSFLLNPRLRSEEEIKTLYRVNVLGNVRSGKKNALDCQILKWRYHRAGTLSLEQEVDIISANVKVACKKENATVYLTGSDISNLSNELLEKLVSNCEEKGITLITGKEISYHADALEQMAEVGQVLFVEQIRGSYCDEIYKEVMICLEHKIPVLGMIVVGA